MFLSKLRRPITIKDVREFYPQNSGGRDRAFIGRDGRDSEEWVVYVQDCNRVRTAGPYPLTSIPDDISAYFESDIAECRACLQTYQHEIAERLKVHDEFSLETTTASSLVKRVAAGNGGTFYKKPDGTRIYIDTLRR